MFSDLDIFRSSRLQVPIKLARARLGAAAVVSNLKINQNVLEKKGSRKQPVAISFTPDGQLCNTAARRVDAAGAGSDRDQFPVYKTF